MSALTFSFVGVASALSGKPTGRKATSVRRAPAAVQQGADPSLAPPPTRVAPKLPEGEQPIAPVPPIPLRAAGSLARALETSLSPHICSSRVCAPPPRAVRAWRRCRGTCAPHRRKCVQPVNSSIRDEGFIVDSARHLRVSLEPPHIAHACVADAPLPIRPPGSASVTGCVSGCQPVTWPMRKPGLMGARVPKLSARPHITHACVAHRGRA
jgi:hypothetical protein